MLKLLKVTGGKKLTGQIQSAGAKNAITKLLVASLISNKECIFRNVPNIIDVEITVNLCREIGMDIDWDKKEKTMRVVTKNLKTSYIPQRFSGANRIPILMIGALLGRTNQDIIVPTVGGDDLGSRPVDFHTSALAKLGAHIEYRQMKREGAYFAQAHQGLKGCVLELPYPSVGATENILLAAVSASGTTTIKNAAVEPEVVELILFLQKLGCNISLDTNRVITIHKNKEFNNVEHTVIADRNEVASYALAAICTKGRVFIEGACHLHMITFLNKLRQANGGFTIKSNGIEFFYQGKLKGGLHIETDVHPGFMTDWQQPFAVLLTQTEGISVIHETVYENRFGYAKALKKMGADLELFTQCMGNKPCRFSTNHHSHSLIIKGPTPLTSQNIVIPDLRAGFAYVVAALIAKGTTKITNVHYLERGYENFASKLQSLGADVEVLNLSDKKDNLSILSPSSLDRDPLRKLS